MDRTEKTKKIAFGIYQITDLAKRIYGFTDKETELLDKLAENKWDKPQDSFSEKEVDFYRDIKKALAYKSEPKIDELYVFVPKHPDCIDYIVHNNVIETSKMRQKIAEDQWIDSDKISIEDKAREVVQFFETKFIPILKESMGQMFDHSVTMDLDNNALILNNHDNIKVKLNDDFYRAVLELHKEVNKIDIENSTEVAYSLPHIKNSPTKSNDLQID